MKISPTISLQEFVNILRESLANKFNCQIENIYIESYNEIKISIDEYDMVECVDFKYRTQE